MEQNLAEIWADVLKIDRVGIEDHFLELGGHSLMAAQIMARVCQRFEVEGSSACIFENPTIAGLSQIIEQLRHHDVGQQISPITAVSRRDYRVSRSHK
jgi:acyl carrier protein